MSESHSSAGSHATEKPALAHTPLFELHRELGAKMVGFAGYEMPVQYPSGIIAEHLHTRQYAGLFDVSHMGQAVLKGEDAAERLESLVPGDIKALAPGAIRYTQLLNGDGNIIDDLMVTRLPDEGASQRLFLVVNAGTKTADFAFIIDQLPDLNLSILNDRALLALQGPRAAEVLGRRLPEVMSMTFMTLREFRIDGMDLKVSRSGYTGEDGFEISVPAAHAESFAKQLLAEPEVKPVGLGARDSLRLEAGLCLYGHDIDTTTNPVEAGLVWSISPRRRREGGFPGDERIRLAIANGPARKRVGLLLEGKAPAREGADITTPEGLIIGRVTSGGFAPSLGKPIAMGYVESEYAGIDRPVELIVRTKPLDAKITALPFVPHHYYRGA
jgi:aminomethyltransferase